MVFLAAAVSTAPTLCCRSVSLLLHAGHFIGSALLAFDVDNVLSEGEVSPIVIVAMLFATSAASAAVWGKRAWETGLLTWAWLPGAHLAKRALGLPDTLQPNTYASMMLLAAFSFVIMAAGLAIGGGVRWLARGEQKRSCSRRLQCAGLDAGHSW